MDVFGAPLTPRQTAIILAVVQEHVATREPVGSKAVQERYLVAASTATIRNEMVELEQCGYLRQPHTSAGRVPCDSAYRLFVNHLFHEARPEPREAPWLQGEYRRLRSEPHEILRTTSRLLARATAHPAVVTHPPAAAPVLAQVSLQPVTAHDAMFSYQVVGGDVRHHLLRSETPFTAALVGEMSGVLQRLYLGQKASSLAGITLSEVQARLPEHIVPADLLAALRQAVEQDDESAVYVDGASYILDEPEFESRDRLRQFMQTLDEDASLRQVMREAVEAPELTVTIGAENRLPGMQSCSLVASAYAVGRARGAVGILGPTRMQYGRIMALVEFTARKLTEAFQPPPREE